ncbi:ARM repeat-containing protein [Serendipita vermifera]|nr:ARM repeat-containing protein [Serendipita vermifera]
MPREVTPMSILQNPALMNHQNGQNLYEGMQAVQLFAMMSHQIGYHDGLGFERILVKFKLSALKLLQNLAYHAQFFKGALASAQRIASTSGRVDSTLQATLIVILSKWAGDPDCREVLHALINQAIGPWKVEMNGGSLEVIIAIVKSIVDGNWSVKQKAVLVLSKLLEQAELHDSLREAIPKIFDLLVYPDWSEEAATITFKMLEYAHLRGNIKDYLPHFVKLLSDFDSETQFGALSAISKASKYADLSNAIKEVIPQIMELLGDKTSSIQAVAACVLLNISGHIDLSDSAVPTIPQLIKLLMIDDLHDTYIASSLLDMLPREEIRNAVKEIIPQIINLIEGGPLPLGVNIVAKMSEYGEPLDTIGETIPLLIKLLGSGDRTVQGRAASILSKMSEAASLRDAVKDAVLHFIRLPGYQDSDAQLQAAVALSNLWDADGVHGIIEAAIVLIGARLGNQDDSVKMEANETLLKLSEQAGLRESLKKTIPALVNLLKDPNEPVRDKAVSTASKLLEDVGLGSSIVNSLLNDASLLRHSTPEVRVGVTALLASWFREHPPHLMSSRQSQPIEGLIPSTISVNSKLLSKLPSIVSEWLYDKSRGVVESCSFIFMQFVTRGHMPHAVLPVILYALGAIDGADVDLQDCGITLLTAMSEHGNYTS